MSSIIKFYYYMCVAMGLINIHYDPKTKSLRLNHWNTIAYVGVNNIIALVYQPFGIILYFRTTFYCEEYYATAYMGGFLTIVHSVTVVVTIVEAWLKRKQFRRVCYVYGILVQQYLSDTKIIENLEVVRKARNVLIRKLISSFCRMVVLYVQLYNRVEDDEYCAYMDNAPFIVSSLYIGFLNLMLVLLDFTVMLGFVLIDLCLNMLLNTLKRIQHDVRLLNSINVKDYGTKQKNTHEKWRLQLKEDIEAIANEVKKLQVLANDHIEIYQVPLLFMLLSVFLTLITIMYRIVSYLDDEERFNSYTFIFLIIVVLANISNSMILFNVCESLTQGFKKISHQVYKIVIEASLINRGLYYRDPLEITLETLTLQLRRQAFKVPICGMFDLHHSAGMAMMSKLILNLIYLIQSVVKEEKEYDDADNENDGAN